MSILGLFNPSPFCDSVNTLRITTCSSPNSESSGAARRSMNSWIILPLSCILSSQLTENYLCCFTCRYGYGREGQLRSSARNSLSWEHPLFLCSRLSLLHSASKLRDVGGELSQISWILFQALPPAHYVTLHKSLHLFVLKASHLQNYIYLC